MPPPKSALWAASQSRMGAVITACPELTHEQRYRLLLALAAVGECPAPNQAENSTEGRRLLQVWLSAAPD